ncbi:MAG: hypothetical protein V7719_03015 [Psychroserpens sp.]|uniref:hypothetical protein n=1 Tax=Psychroserpens sp. TaxID=2020870 RepID=UPI0030039E39
MKKQMHLAAQYLAAAGISFLNKESDDSHTNLGFNTDSGTLSTHMLSENEDRLSLNYQKFTLDWNSLSGNTSFRLDGATHKQVVQWISDVSQTYLNKKYKYQLHYDLPYSITDDYIFKLHNVSDLQSLMHLRILAQFSLERISKDNLLESPIRVWPHHFDTGIYEKMPDSDVSIGLGLAIPDTNCDEHYMYISGYKKNETIDTSSFGKLENGEWRTNEFKGAILPATRLIESETVTFFQEAINTYKNQY